MNNRLHSRILIMNVDIISVLDMVDVQVGGYFNNGTLLVRSSRFVGWRPLSCFFCINVILSVIKQANVRSSDARLFIKSFD